MHATMFLTTSHSTQTAGIAQQPIQVPYTIKTPPLAASSTVGDDGDTGEVLRFRTAPRTTFVLLFFQMVRISSLL